MIKRPESVIGGAAKRLGLGLISTILVALLGFFAPAASASALPHTQTRVAAIGNADSRLVAPHDSVLAVQGRERPPNYDQHATGSSVAAEGGADATAAARAGVYTLRDEAGNVVRTGRTGDLAAREMAHANDPVLGQFDFNVEYSTDNYAEQRGLEQMLYDQYPRAQAANGGYNFIRGISLSNPNLDLYMRAAEQYLAQMGGG